jgi:hypothetical protein
MSNPTALRIRRQHFSQSGAKGIFQSHSSANVIPHSHSGANISHSYSGTKNIPHSHSDANISHSYSGAKIFPSVTAVQTTFLTVNSDAKKIFPSVTTLQTFLTLTAEQKYLTFTFGQGWVYQAPQTLTLSPSID